MVPRGSVLPLHGPTLDKSRDARLVFDPMRKRCDVLGLPSAGIVRRRMTSLVKALLLRRRRTTCLTGSPWTTGSGPVLGDPSGLSGTRP